MFSRPDRSLRWDVLEEHLSEASFLWTQWENRLKAPSHTLKEVAEGEEGRLRAHLDALVAGGRRVAARLLKPTLEEDDGERIRAAGFVLLSPGEGQDVPCVLEHFSEEGEETNRASLQRALQMSECTGLSDVLRPLLAIKEPGLQSAVLEVLRFRRTHPGTPFAQLLSHPDPEVKAAALRAAKLWPTEVDANLVRQALASPEPPVREAGLETGLILGLKAAWTSCRQWASAPDAAGHVARVALACGGDRHDLEQLLELLAVPALQRSVLWALGFSGRLAAAQASLRWLRDPTLAGVAAEAFCSITGLSLQGHMVRERDQETGEEPVALEDEDLDADLLPGPDEELVLPEPAAIEAWWAEAQKNFSRDIRYLCGQPFSFERLLDGLEQLPMRRRPVLALELAIRSHGQHQIETQDFTHIQRMQVRTAWERPERSIPMGPFADWMRS
ncbi:TIGR02270 family protein [Archangium sp.]|uniref:TIGR02270 family protein n=1 Tax=Archangium sp. TaxID=1872627 RepID=UPI0039C88535